MRDLHTWPCENHENAFTQHRDPIRAGNTEHAGEVFRLRVNLVTFLPTIEIAVVRGHKREPIPWLTRYGGASAVVFHHLPFDVISHQSSSTTA